ncbi:MAG: hypothetical protein AB200_00310 [Parcubacteria bacterium C7867-005]|nr:MAG: hypothetical protein AB200_00310 [Parcubacteria bacterium C7867-005]
MANMEDLTKTQMVLLTLLVSFVTSIATGIITVSLLAEAPASVTQTINRVVERTIEKVTPTNPTSSGVKEVTIVKEEDAIISAIDKSVRAIVRIKTPVDPYGTQNFYALGVVVSKDGLVLSDKRTLVLNGIYDIVLADGTVLQANIVRMSEEDNLALFRITPDIAHTNNFDFISVSDSELKLGQTAIAIQGMEKNTIGIGRIMSVNYRNEADTKTLYSVDTDISSINEIQGSPLFNLSGELVGIKTSYDDLSVPRGAYTTSVPMSAIVELAQQ